MAAIAKLSDFPTRSFKSRYWDMPDGPTVYAYVSDETKPIMVAIDLHEVGASPAMETLAAKIRAGLVPFREAREVRAGVHGHFLVAEVSA
ncbi:hypothetical protein HZF05_10395 [Sphingomonas sp. CGMCC 1.13654]|uniref:Uncharacterized protein n=1 Tax=Sphingomonas chungangi TaxID=2683589 RepID=A0A838L723_9SPHN|nr:hypothetical protein [Sphingomonas chungangi]MBA2934505.1 hypothetical protein [Sphingomonas chungangi]MVW57544.1 hypothetical protein [Sphingomonas chungangi]